jgi:exodeoxyribonuclease X
MTKIVAFDVETTGLDPNTHDIIEIAAVGLSADTAEIIWTDNSLVAITSPVPPHISGITSIIDDDLAGQPFADEIVPKMIGDADVLVAHNMAFDAKFVARWIKPDARLVCTYRLGVRRWPDAENHKLQTLRYVAGLIEMPGFDRRFLDGAHSALPDAVICAGLFQGFYRALDCDVDRLVTEAAKPAPLTKLRFGKHAGQRISDVPGDYLSWLHRSTNDDDIRRSVASELARREGRLI